ncbi:MAG: hypothetical protein KF695_03155 [Simplicispira sp.]|jgi:hypothetical protein|nr:hypothetical protein [Simplicispira sp.]
MTLIFEPVHRSFKPENSYAATGRRIARENAEREILQLLSFRLRDELAR